MPRNDEAKNKLLEQWKRQAAIQKEQRNKEESSQETTQELIQEPTKKLKPESTQEHKQETTNKENNLDQNNDDKNVRRQKQTCIMKLVRDNPEMPEKLELDDTQRKQLAELMLEYPTKEEQLEVENSQDGQIGEKRIFTCLHCEKNTTR